MHFEAGQQTVIKAAAARGLEAIIAVAALTSLVVANARLSQFALILFTLLFVLQTICSKVHDSDFSHDRSNQGADPPLQIMLQNEFLAAAGNRHKAICLNS